MDIGLTISHLMGEMDPALFFKTITAETFEDGTFTLVLPFAGDKIFRRDEEGYIQYRRKTESEYTYLANNSTRIWLQEK